MKAVKKSATRTAMRTLDGTENTEGREEGGRGQGRGEKESKVGRKSVYVAREREREGKLELLWDTGVGGRVGRLTG